MEEKEWTPVFNIIDANNYRYFYNLPKINGARLCVKYDTGTINEFIFWDNHLGFVDSYGLSYALNYNVKYWKYYA